MRKRLHFALMAAAFFLVQHAGPALGDEGDDTLRFYLSKSDLVVVGTITSEPGGRIFEVVVVHYWCDFAVSDVLKGEDLAKKEVAVNIVRLEVADKDRLPDVKKGAKCILFLKAMPKGQILRWQSADVWFAFQRYDPLMARSLKRLAAEKPQAE